MKRDKKRCLVCFIGILAISMIFLGARSCDPCKYIQIVELPEFLFGTSQGGPEVVPLAAELGARWIRGKVSWDDVEPEILIQTLTVADVKANPAMIIYYINTHDWSYSDTWLAEMKNNGMEPLMIIGHGYSTTLPYFNGQRITPDILGRENYLGHIYLFTRAAVERYNGDGEYDAPGGLVVKYWQLENELNQAFFTALWGWRTPSFMDALGSAWQDWNFVTELLATLYEAVKIEDPLALTTVNFHTDVPAEINQSFLLPSWQDSIRLWLPWVDFIGIDAYPNYYIPEPVNGEILAQRIAEAYERGCGKPVVVIETGYPSGPPERGYNETLQAQYIQEAFDAAVSAGALGFFLFGVKTGETHGIIITPEDIANLEYLADLYNQGLPIPLIAWALLNQDYIQNHFIDVMQSVESYWGLVRIDGSHKPGWHVFQSLTIP
ncbi:MAG: hypothetical protein A2161_07630 [Candidatus Schekmanbacteria bacterium RBG_13_48_7]|uniref:Glycoside hydrolase family 42 N-terminal domain-containing protein n=1 Tax=Candidatus Schekmanbacteria bacterium RBG_13_48_7 TaxID=1817878 RepID=A0A1F7S356_9BACT|nr:MAG: hypothetical protein A2161_07630 [Candidatus Schekmanbacteria bacterium RBG_13_48_7]